MLTLNHLVVNATVNADADDYDVIDDADADANLTTTS